MVKTHVLGYPRIGPRRELKYALESYWRGEPEAKLLATARGLRAARHAQQAASLSWVTAGDFSLYDTMLDHAVLFGCLPRRFGFDPRRLTLQEYFALARGSADQPTWQACSIGAGIDRHRVAGREGFLQAVVKLFFGVGVGIVRYVVRMRP